MKIEALGSKSSGSTERSKGQIPLFIKCRINKPLINDGSRAKNKYTMLEVKNNILDDYNTNAFENISHMPSSNKFAKRNPNIALFESTPVNRLNTSRYSKNLKPNLIKPANDRSVQRSIDKSSAKNLSTESIITVQNDHNLIKNQKQSINNFNSNKRSKGRILK